MYEVDDIYHEGIPSSINNKIISIWQQVLKQGEGRHSTITVNCTYDRSLINLSQSHKIYFIPIFLKFSLLECEPKDSNTYYPCYRLSYADCSLLQSDK